jgi:hypothetical protein
MRHAVAAFLELGPTVKGYCDRVSFAMSQLAPIETFVDWLEAAYAGPIHCDPSASPERHFPNAQPTR